MEKSARQKMFDLINNNLGGALLTAGNTLIEEALIAYGREKSRENEYYVKETIRVRMLQGAQLIVPYQESPDSKPAQLKTISLPNGQGTVLVAYTGFDVMDSDSRGVSQGIRQMIEKVLISDAMGILLNPDMGKTHELDYSSNLRGGFFISREDSLWLLKACYDPEHRFEVILYPRITEARKEYMKVPKIGDKNQAKELLRDLCNMLFDNYKKNDTHMAVVLSTIFRAEDLSEEETARTASEAAASWLKKNQSYPLYVRFFCESKKVFDIFQERLGDPEPFMVKG